VWSHLGTLALVENGLELANDAFTEPSLASRMEQHSRGVVPDGGAVRRWSQSCRDSSGNGKKWQSFFECWQRLKRS
jgi:hypothetical protein